MDDEDEFSPECLSSLTASCPPTVAASSDGKKRRKGLQKERAVCLRQAITHPKRSKKLSVDEKCVKNAFIFIFKTERGVRMPLLDSNLEMGRFDSH
jgi:hypothetical protein